MEFPGRRGAGFPAPGPGNERQELGAGRQAFRHQPGCAPLRDEEIPDFLTLSGFPHPWVISPNKNSLEIQSPREEVGPVSTVPF